MSGEIPSMTCPGATQHAITAVRVAKPYLVYFLGLSALVLCLLGFFLHLSYRQTEQAAQTASHNESLILAYQIDSALRRIDSNSSFIADTLLPAALSTSITPAITENVNETLRTLTTEFPEVLAYLVFNTTGKLLFSNQPVNATVDIADRDFFIKAKFKPVPGLFFSETLKAKSTGTWALIAYRSILSPSGAFLGLMAIPVDLGHLARAFSEMHVGPQGMISMRRSDDSRLVVRWPEVAGEVNLKAERTPPFQLIQSGREEGVVRYVGKTDKVDRIFAYKQIRGYPFYVVVGRAHLDVFQPWRNTALLSSLLTISGLLMLGWFFLHLRRSEKSLREREAVMSAIVGQAGDAIELTDLETMRFVEFNQAAYTLLGYTQEEYARLSVQDIQADWSPEQTRVMASEARPGQEFRFETLHRRKDGSVIDVQVSLRIIDLNGHPHAVAIWTDIRARKASERALQESSLRYQAMKETTQDGFWVADLDGHILEVNQSYCTMSGYSRDELAHMTISELDARESRDETASRIQRIIEQGHDQFESLQQRKNGEVWHVEVSVSHSPTEGGRMYCFLRDISERKRNEQLADLSHQLMDLAQHGDQDRLLRAALDVGEALTHSQIGFLHFVEPDQENVSLQVWSTRTLSEMCFAEGKGLHYPISQAGVWVDCIHQSQPVIHNDYAALPDKKGMPQGHAKLVREATVPLVRNDSIVAVIGVGNKPHDYTDDDIRILQQILGMAIDFADRQQAEQRLEHMAYHDLLTGLPNRTLLADRLAQSIALSRRSNQLIAVCCLDLDNFKPLNDSYGHHVGDSILVGLARRMQESLRQGDTLARLGGDEFAIILTGLSTGDECEDAVKRLLTQVNRSIDTQGHTIDISGSIGVTLFPIDDVPPDVLLRHADQAMYQAKSTNKSGFRFYDPVQDQQLRQLAQTREDFAEALRGDQLMLHYQPKINLSDGSVFGMEALIRWQHPQRGLLAPGQFLPMIEETELEFALGEWVVNNALTQLQQWLEAGLPLSVSINISPRHIQQQGFVDFLVKTLASYPPGIAGNLEIEVLEISAISDTANAAKVMDACKKLGLHFSLDDFGTGYSTLTHFHHLPIDVVKIDQNFVRNMLVNTDDLDIVEGVLRLADGLKRPAVAEGIESVEIGIMLLHLGCLYGQGYGIARPMPGAQVAGWLAGWEGNSVWHQLGMETHGESSHYDLSVAIFSHRNWLGQVVAHLRNSGATAAPSLDEGQCQFGRWYLGIGRAHYGSHPSYAFVQALHHQIHSLAANLVDLAATGQPQVAQAGIEDLLMRGEELTDLLRALDHTE